MDGFLLTFWLGQLGSIELVNVLDSNCGNDSSVTSVDGYFYESAGNPSMNMYVAYAT